MTTMAQADETKLQAGEDAPAPGVPANEKVGEVVELSEAYTAEERKAVVRKIDLVILPMVRFSYTSVHQVVAGKADEGDP